MVSQISDKKTNIKLVCIVDLVFRNESFSPNYNPRKENSLANYNRWQISSHINLMVCILCYVEGM